ncbi:DUF2752 domain-containing protein [Herbivorax sp. ANBcel31]|uniref:DUF2752 domain-containing protein n=1 Tax=Herbivorax sp. ANBcel31 TaxID=3069754 RepID=UPI0027B7F992|nr:DUF2752 domain-containing protein [Herbivorax sp. ANBcel31]MDQ2088061.1 DUF2752 domain-containing protein [Herbivorax sp. ANBcel31]
MKKIIVIFVVVGLISVGLSLITDKSICVFLNLTGLPCPSCGMTRAVILFVKGDLSGAFYYHPLFFLPFVVVLINYKKVRQNKVIFNGLVYALIAIFLVVYIIRLVKLFPDKEPFLFYSDGLLPMVFQFIKSLFNTLYAN